MHAGARGGTRRAPQCCGFVRRRALPPPLSPPAAQRLPRRRQQHRSSSSSAAASSSSPPPPSGICPTVIIRRQFLKQVHPDFFAEFAKERAINGENLKLLNAVLEPSSSSDPFPFPRSFPNTAANTKASPRNLTFYLKPPPPSPSPARVIVPLDGDRGAVFTALREILQAHCKELALPVLPVPPSSSRARAAGPTQQQQQQQQQYRYDHPYGDAWARARANARRRQRGWRAWAAGEEARPGMDDEEGDEEEEDDDDERPPPFLDLYLEAAGRREGKWGTMQARRAAAAEVGRRVAALKARWGFEEIELRVDWAAEFLLVTLQRLEAALQEYRSGGEETMGFGGLDLVVMQHDIARDAALDVGEGRILLCPSDSPLQWMAALGEATPRMRERARALRRLEATLVRAVQNVALPGAVVERGHTCSRSEYRAFLRRCLLLGSNSLRAGNGEEEEEEEEDYGDHEAAMAMAVAMDGGVGLPSRRWEGLRLRVERGERPCVLESGVLQIDGPRVRSHAYLQALVGRWAEDAQAAAAREHEASLRLFDLQQWLQHPGSGLGLTNISRDAAVSVGEATRCLERLLALPGDHPVRAALRGAAVGGRLVVVKAGYGWSRDGVLRVPWDWDVARRG